jgi:hypothetical protein
MTEQEGLLSRDPKETDKTQKPNTSKRTDLVPGDQEESRMVLTSQGINDYDDDDILLLILQS